MQFCVLAEPFRRGLLLGVSLKFNLLYVISKQSFPSSLLRQSGGAEPQRGTIKVQKWSGGLALILAKKFNLNLHYSTEFSAGGGFDFGAGGWLSLGILKGSIRVPFLSKASRSFIHICDYEIILSVSSKSSNETESKYEVDLKN